MVERDVGPDHREQREARRVGELDALLEAGRRPARQHPGGGDRDRGAGDRCPEEGLVLDPEDRGQPEDQSANRPAPERGDHADDDRPEPVEGPARDRDHAGEREDHGPG
jgi:hypothetical protein